MLPGLVKRRCRIFPAEICTECIFESATKKHGRFTFFFLPTFDIPAAISSRAIQIAVQLCVAVHHGATSTNSGQVVAGENPSSVSERRRFERANEVRTTPVSPGSNSRFTVLGSGRSTGHRKSLRNHWSLHWFLSLQS